MINKVIRVTWVFSFAITATMSIADNAMAQDIRTLAEDCEMDLAKYCADITPGETRQIACLIAHNDKVSPGCRLTAYLAGKALANSIMSLEKLSWKCSADIPSLCGNVLPGGGRIYGCLKKNRARLGDSCRQGLPAFEEEFINR